MDDFDMLGAPQGSAGNGIGADEDPAAAFLAQQESEIAGIENDEGFSILDSGEVPSSLIQDPDGGFTRPLFYTTSIIIKTKKCLCSLITDQSDTQAKSCLTRSLASQPAS